MDRIILKLRTKILWLVLLTALVVFWGRPFVSSVFINYGWIQIEKLFVLNERHLQGMQADLKSLFFENAVHSSRKSISARRGLGFAYWFNGKDLQALKEWTKIGLTASDYVRAGSMRVNLDDALRWYKLAEIVDPSNAELWLRVGQVCQSNPYIGDICKRFLAYNDHNLFVDPQFAFDREAWHFNRRRGADYTIAKCSGVPDKKCALVHIHTVTSPHGTSWVQCLTLTPEKKYRFSAWVKVQSEGEWIALYYQGDRNGHPHGVKLGGSHTGVKDWIYFEQEFIAPKFDDHRACFHPLRLLAMGNAWFHSADLQLVE
jgi:hypothetical protein